MSDRTRQVCATVFQRFIYEVYPAAGSLRQQAATQVEDLGGSDLPATGSPLFEKLSKRLGWRLAKHVQHFLYALGYRRWLLHFKRQAFTSASTLHDSLLTHG